MKLGDKRMGRWGKTARLTNYVLRAIGIDLSKILSYRYLPKYLADRWKFKNAGGSIALHLPILNEFNEEAGIANGQYFHQDLVVASYVYKASPQRHIDIGSRIDGFVAHVASFRDIEYMDIRELQPSEHERIKFIQANIMKDNPSYHEVADSISCLHAIEHFGLGRYGDPICPNGHTIGFTNIVRMLKDGGTLYVSFPIGTSTRVEFNAQRVFHPREIFAWAGHENLELVQFDYVDDAGRLHQSFPLMDRLPPVNR